MDNEEFEEGYEEVDDDLEYEEDGFESEGNGTDDDPWSWAQGVDPNDVKKTWTQYTQTREEALAAKREAERLKAELEPIAKLREEIMEDPGLVEVIQSYMTGARPADREVADLKRQLTGMQQQLAVKEELVNLKSWVKEKGYPDVDERAVLEYAATNGIGNLRAAYSDMNIEAIQDARANRVVSGIKKSKGAKTLKSSGESSKRSGKFTQEDLTTMSDEDFLTNYEAIMESLAQG